MDFTYEKVGNTNYIVAEFPGGKGLINYQVQMLENNTIKNIIKVSKRQKNDDVQLFYNITGMLPLEHAIGSKKISKTNLISIIEGTLAAMSDIEDYQLVSGGLVFDSDKIFVKQGSFVPNFIYVPDSMENIGVEPLKKLILGFIMGSKVEMSNDNFVQALIEALNSPDLSADALKKLCLKYKNGNVQQKIRDVSEREHVSHNEPPRVEPQSRPETIEPKQKNENKEIPNVKKQPAEKKQKAEKSKSKDKNTKKPLFIILQAAFVAIIAGACVSGILTDESGALNLQYLLGIVIGIAAADFIIYREMFINSKNKGEETPENKAKSQKKPEAKKPSIALPGRDVPTKAEVKPEVQKPEPKRNITKPQPEEKPIVQNYDDFVNEATEVLDNEATVVMTDAPGQAAYLEFYDNGLSTKIRLEKEKTIVGKLKSRCDFAINNNKISKVHAEFVIRNGECFVKDCSSTNGTYINGGSRLESGTEYRIYNDDRITLADVDLTFKC